MYLRGWTCAPKTRLKFLVVAIFLLCPAILPSQDQRLSAEKRSQIEAAVSKFMASTHVPGMSVAVFENGYYEWRAGYGFADLEKNVPATEHTLLRLASISKTLTAVGVMELWERGKLDLDVPVQKYCPSFPQKSGTITSREVMGHLGGIRHYKAESQDDPEVGNTKHFENPIEGGLDFFKNDPLVAEPGSHFHYSTQGYTILGCGREGASGAKYPDYMRQSVFRPLPMPHPEADARLPLVPYPPRF